MLNRNYRALPDEDLYRELLAQRHNLEELVNLYNQQDSRVFAGTVDDPMAFPNSEVWLLRQEARRRCRQDLYFLSYYVLWESTPEGLGKPVEENGICRDLHGIMCDLFVRKDNTRSVFEQDVFKKRILLYPRGTYKSTIDVYDAVQWILNFPDIRILFLTAEKGLATGFVSTIKGHFQIFSTPTLLNLLFPEFCATETELDKEDKYRFTCPVWKRKKIRRKEATVFALSVESSMAGYHWEVVKADDTVQVTNSGNEEICAKVFANFSTNIKMLMKGGYLDLIGTRYHDADMYGIEYEQATSDEDIGQYVRHESPENGPTVEYVENHSTMIKLLIGRAIVIKRETLEKLEKEGRPATYAEAGEDGCNLLAPKQLPYSFLMTEWRGHEGSFESQRNQNPRPKSILTFPKHLLQAHTIPFTELPVAGPISIVWDFAFSKKKGRDYSTAAVVMWDDKGRMFVIDLIRNRFRHTELAKAVVDLARKWKPFIIGIEDAAGSRMIEPTIWAEAEKTNAPFVVDICRRIDWFPPDTQEDAKRQRMAALHPWLVYDRMYFAAHLPWLQKLYDEFERCLVTHHHDDIPDVLSMQPRYAPRMRELTLKKETSSYSRAEAGWNLMFEEGTDPFGRVGFGPPPQPVAQVIPEAEIRAPQDDGLDPILGAF